MNSKPLKTDLKKLKLVLIVLTVIELTYFVIAFMNDELWIKLDYDYKANYIIGAFHIIVMILFIKFNWKKMPLDRNRKRDYTYMILFLGLVGMWLWMPNKKQIEKMNIE